MKRLLYISYFFPPLGGAGVQRALKFSRYLPEFGWEPTILSTRDAYWMEDSAQLAELPPETRILRAPSFSPGGRGVGKGGARAQGRIRWLRRWSRIFLVPDAYLGWVARARPLARRELRERRYDALLTTSSPDSAHLLGRGLKRETGLPWVADFRDPWTRRLSYDPPTPLHHAWHRHLEGRCLREADAVVVTTEETKKDLLRLYPDLSGGKLHVIPNGYDEEDFRRASEAMSSVPPADPLRGGADRGDEPILHAGQLNPERPITPYLEGLRLFLDRSPQRRGEVRTLFLGGHYDRDFAEVRRRGLDTVVRFAGSRPHLESVAALLRATILLLIEQNSDRGRLILPGKVFEYLRAGRPILAVVPPAGAAARLVRSCDAGVVADPSSAESVAEGIRRLCDAVRSRPDGEVRGFPASPAGAIAAFERRALTGSLARLLDQLSPPA